jgi:hypothetical protein
MRRALALFIVPVSLAFSLGCSKDTRVAEIEPNTGTFAGGEEVHINGANFPKAGVQVRFGTKEATGVAVESDHMIKAFTPAGDKNTTTDVSIIFDDGRAFQLKNGFRYVDSTQQANTADKFFDKVGGKK